MNMKNSEFQTPKSKFKMIYEWGIRIAEYLLVKD